MDVCIDDFKAIENRVQRIGVTTQYRDVIDTLYRNEDGTPPGFKRLLCMEQSGVLRVDLVRDISYDKNEMCIRDRYRGNPVCEESRCVDA